MTSILNELSSATGDKASNAALVKRCLETPALLHTVAEGLRSGVTAAQQDCARIMIDVAKRNPDLLGPFVNDLIDATHNKSKRVVKLAFSGLELAAASQPSDVFAEREYLLETARGGGTTGLAAATVLAALCAQSANYRGKLQAHALRLLRGVPDKELPRWATVLSRAVAGSPDGVKRFERELDPRLPPLDESARRKVERVIASLQRSVKRKR